MTSSPEYEHMLVLLGKAVHALRTKHNQKAVLVGGAAVEFYTGGMYATGDFDLFFQDFNLFDEVIKEFGFLREEEVGRLSNGWYHPSCPTHGVQLVSGRLFDGKSDSNRLQLVKISKDSDIIIPPIEDLIADRLGQYCSRPNNPDDSTLEQAKLLLTLAESIDWAYLRQRVHEDQGDISLLEGVRP